jgi:hypothetical protein
MTAAEYASVMTALAALIAAVATLAGLVHSWRKAIDGRMDALLALTAKAARAEGVLQEKGGLETQLDLTEHPDSLI